MATKRNNRGTMLNPAEPSGSPSSREPRITPRNSDLEADAVAKDTPYGTLRQLANIGPKPSTPLRRASSAGPQPIHRSSRRTPAAQAKTPNAAHRLMGSGKRTIAVTPHGRAAAREVEARRAGLTPGKDRRRSGRQQRETPRDALRLLSRALAPKSLPIVPTPQGQSIGTNRAILTVQDDLDDREPEAPPRLSMALDEDEDDSLLLPPRSAGLEDENFTVQSVEMPRRATSEQPGGRFSRGSFGSIRTSDRFENLEMGLDLPFMGGLGSSFATGDAFGEDADIANMADMSNLQGDQTETLRGLGLAGRLSAGRNSDIRPVAVSGDDSEATFVFTIPQRDMSEGHQSDVDQPSSEDEQPDGFYSGEQDAIETEDQEPFLDDPDSGPDPVPDRVMHEDLGHLHQTSTKNSRGPSKKKVKMSKHGVHYTPLPAGVVKKLATTFARTGGSSKAKISKDALEAIMQASDWFFEQISDDLGVYARHAGRKTIDESDVMTVIKRQRQMNATSTAFSLAQRYLPRELLQEMRMAPPPTSKKSSQLATVKKANEAEE